MLLSPLSIVQAAGEASVPWTMPHSDVLTIAADDGHPYRVMVAWPDEAPPPGGWPVLYVLDGDDNFAAVAMTARRLARAGGRDGVAAGVVVAVESGGLPRRVADYTPPVAGYTIPQGAPAHGLATGGGDRFLDFLHARVQPAIAVRWRIDPARQTLLGHSFGGLLALHAAFTRPTMFSGYAAISPSLWFGDNVTEREERAARDLSGTRILVAVGGDERGPDGSSGAALEALAQRVRAKGAAVRMVALPGQSHGTTMLAAMGEAIALAFAAPRGTPR